MWRQFVAVADSLHFGRAASRLHMTQPPLTQAIATLEERLGVRLFDRTKRSVQLTDAGKSLLPQARELLARAMNLSAHARATAQGEAGRLRLAFVSTVAYQLLPQWIQAFRMAYPRIELDLVELTGDAQLQSLEQGDIDAGFMLHSVGLEPPGVHHLRVIREPLLLALPQQHELAITPKLALGRALDLPLVIFPRRTLPSVHDAVFAMYHAAGRTPHVAQEAVQMLTLVNLVAAGLGVAWVPETVRQLQRAGITYRPISGKQAEQVPKVDTSLVWLSTDSPTLNRFLAFVRANLSSDPEP